MSTPFLKPEGYSLGLLSLNHPPKRLYTTSNPKIAIASAKIKAKIIDIKILGAAAGFLPKACTLA
jgi:hypothetical protein